MSGLLCLGYDMWQALHTLSFCFRYLPDKPSRNFFKKAVGWADEGKVIQSKVQTGFEALAPHSTSLTTRLSLESTRSFYGVEGKEILCDFIIVIYTPLIWVTSYSCAALYLEGESNDKRYLRGLWLITRAKVSIRVFRSDPSWPLIQPSYSSDMLHKSS